MMRQKKFLLTLGMIGILEIHAGLEDGLELIDSCINLQLL